jgi:hypothetical protein
MGFFHNLFTAATSHVRRIDLMTAQIACDVPRLTVVRQGNHAEITYWHPTTLKMLTAHVAIDSNGEMSLNELLQAVGNMGYPVGTILNRLGRLGY